MSPDDRRHGSHAGYAAGCRLACCRAGMRRYENQRRLFILQHGEGLAVPSWRGRRRLHALRALGWSVPAIAEHMGVKHQTVYWVERSATITRARFELIERTYDALSMRVPPTDTLAQRVSVAKAQRRAEREGWAPPLAWDDIDDPDERPAVRRRDRHGSAAHDLDQAVVERILAGEYRLRATRAEKVAVVARWLEHGWPISDLERWAGWAPHRYVQQQEAS